MNHKKFYRPDSSLYREVLRDEEGHYHREDGPAFIWYYEDGVTIKCKVWCKHGKWHRLDGPSEIWYDEDGSIKKEFWYIDDEELTEEQVLAHKRNLIINKLLS